MNIIIRKIFYILISVFVYIQIYFWYYMNYFIYKIKEKKEIILYFFIIGYIIIFKIKNYINNKNNKKHTQEKQFNKTFKIIIFYFL